MGFGVSHRPIHCAEALPAWAESILSKGIARLGQSPAMVMLPISTEPQR